MMFLGIIYSHLTWTLLLLLLLLVDRDGWLDGIHEMYMFRELTD